MGSLLDLDQCYFKEDFNWAFRTEHPPRLARAHPITQIQAAELSGLLGGCFNFHGFRLSVNLFMGMFVELKIDDPHNFINRFRKVLVAFASGDESVLTGDDEAAVTARSMLHKHFSPNATDVVTASGQLKRLRSFAAAEAKKLPQRGRPRDRALHILLESLDELARVGNAPRGLGSNKRVNYISPPLVQFTARVLSLTGDLGLVVVKNRPELNEEDSSNTCAYFKYIRTMPTRVITDTFRKVRLAKSKNQK